MQDFDAFYESLLGLRTGEAALPGVENAFAPGSLCDREYGRMRESYLRICERLHAGEEDTDLEDLVAAMEAIQRALCRRIYEIHRP